MVAVIQWGDGGAVPTTAGFLRLFVMPLVSALGPWRHCCWAFFIAEPGAQPGAMRDHGPLKPRLMACCPCQPSAPNSHPALLAGFIKWLTRVRVHVTQCVMPLAALLPPYQLVPTQHGCLGPAAQGVALHDALPVGFDLGNA